MILLVASVAAIGGGGIVGLVWAVASFMDRRDKERHAADAKVASERHASLMAAINAKNEVIGTLVVQYGRLNRTAIDHGSVLEDHAEKLERLLPGERVRRPDPKP